MFAALTSSANANPTIDLKNEFCGARYCGQVSTYSKRKVIAHKHKRYLKKRVAHKAKKIHLASLGPITNEPTHNNLIAKASQYIGMNARQVGVRLNLWCSAFLRKLTNAKGVDDRAISWLKRPRTAKRIGAIAVMAHHVGIVKGFDRSGNPILISGNHGHRVGVGVYSKYRILAYVEA